MVRPLQIYRDNRRAELEQGCNAKACSLVFLSCREMSHSCDLVGEFSWPGTPRSHLSSVAELPPIRIGDHDDPG